MHKTNRDKGVMPKLNMECTFNHCYKKFHISGGSCDLEAVVLVPIVRRGGCLRPILTLDHRILSMRPIGDDTL